MPHLKRIVVFVHLLLLAVGGCEEDESRVVKRSGEPDYVRTSNDALMDRAVQKARQTQSAFVAALQKPQRTYRGFAVKKPFPTPDGGQEHIWINEPTWDGKRFRGTVNNEPVDTRAVKLGDVVTVTPEELTDWMYIDGKKLVGGYTVRVLHYQGTPQQQREFVEQTGIEVPPVDF